MKAIVQTAGFAFKLADKRIASVLFMFAVGKPAHVEIQFSDGVGDCRVPNLNGEWKPCATHCKRLIERAVKANPSTAKPARPKVDSGKQGLKIFRG